MKKITTVSPASDSSDGKRQPAPPRVETRNGLALFIGVPLKRLTYVLYKRDRMSAYREIQIPKASGKIRTLHAVSGPLKSLQRRALERLEKHFKPSAYAHGFTTGRSIITNAAYHRRKKLIIKVDIENFFPSINFARVQGMFQGPPFNFGKEAAVTLAQLACLDDKESLLPQGGVLSPYVANMMCRRLDSRLATLAKEHRCQFTRYADDITLSTNDVAKLDSSALIAKIYEVIESENFTPNRNKTRILEPKDRQIVTGIVVNDGVNVNRKYLRNVRAILRNCERHGIESQVVKAGGFKDERNSRIKIKKTAGGYMHGGVPIKADNACLHFLWHLLGRINFIGQVVRANGQGEKPDVYRRVFAYERLLMRFYNLIYRERKYKTIEHAVRSRISEHPNLRDKLTSQQKRDQVRREVQLSHLNLPDVKAAIAAVKDMETIKELQLFVENIAHTDVRFFRYSLPSDINEARKSIVRMLRYPRISQGKTRALLYSLQDSLDGLGGLTHEKEEFTPEAAYALLVKHYDPVAYYVPYRLRKLFDTYIDKLNEVVMERGISQPIDVISDVKIAPATQALKIGTRFGGHPCDATSLKGVVGQAIAYARHHVKRPSVTILESKVKKTGFYTHVDSVTRALKNILHSMLKNTEGGEIGIQACTDDSNPEVFEITVFDNSESILEGGVSRSFVHGKLGDAVRTLNGLCDYWVETEFDKGGRQCIDMYTGEPVSSDLKTTNGFVHRLRFYIPAERKKSDG